MTAQQAALVDAIRSRRQQHLQQHNLTGLPNDEAGQTMMHPLVAILIIYGVLVSCQGASRGAKADPRPPTHLTALPACSLS
jgi:hypothetical protein